MIGISLATAKRKELAVDRDCVPEWLAKTVVQHFEPLQLIARLTAAVVLGHLGVLVVLLHQTLSERIFPLLYHR